MATTKNLYRGFSSFEFQRSKSFRMTDLELVKMDILNHIFTRKGSVVMEPSFGTSIPDLVFEPLDEETVDRLEEELIKVIKFDPRVELIDLKMTPLPDLNTVMAEIALYYVELNIQDNVNLNIQFEGA